MLAYYLFIIIFKGVGIILLSEYFVRDIKVIGKLH